MFCSGALDPDEDGLEQEEAVREERERGHEPTRNGVSSKKQYKTSSIDAQPALDAKEKATKKYW